MNTELEKAKRLVKAQLVADHAQAFHKLRERRPELSATQALEALEVEEPALVAAARAAEDDAWPEPKPEQAPYRYDPFKSPVTDQAKLDELLSRFGTKKVQARKPAPEIDKSDCTLVYGASD